MESSARSRSFLLLHTFLQREAIQEAGMQAHGGGAHPFGSSCVEAAAEAPHGLHLRWGWWVGWALLHARLLTLTGSDLEGGG